MLAQSENRFKTFEVTNEQKLNQMRETIEKRLNDIRESNNKSLPYVNNIIKLSQPPSSSSGGIPFKILRFAQE